MKIIRLELGFANSLLGFLENLELSRSQSQVREQICSSLNSAQIFELEEEQVVVPTESVVIPIADASEPEIETEITEVNNDR